MNKIQQTFQNFLATQGAEISVWGFLLNLILAAILSFVLGHIYMRYGNALSNRTLFARNFFLLTVTTMLVISVVKSSLALSLGLVGALSIVRFRAAIKEPEELAYLFFAIAIGLGLGANQRVITLVAFVAISAIILLRNLVKKKEENENLYLTISSHNPQKADLNAIVEILKIHCSKIRLKRFDETKEILEASFLVEYEGFSQLEASKSDLQKLSESMKVTFLDNKGIGV
jgi:uncharacterized membrane protein YhiD involved in acid resistance